MKYEFIPYQSTVQLYLYIIFFEAMKKIIQFLIFKIILAHSLNTWNESVCILRIGGMNLYIF